MAHLGNEEILEGVANPDMTVYQYVESDNFRLSQQKTIIFEEGEEYEDF